MLTLTLSLLCGLQLFAKEDFLEEGTRGRTDTIKNLHRHSHFYKYVDYTLLG